MTIHTLKLKTLTAKQFEHEFHGIPYGTKTLSMTDCALTRRHTELLVNAFSCIENSVKKIDLSYNKLCRKPARKIIELLRTLPLSIHTLDLSNNLFYRRTASELCAIFQNIPSSVKRLNFSYNNIGGKPAAELAQILSAIPAWVKDLDLTGNNLYGEDLGQVIAAIPQTVEVLRLSNNVINPSRLAVIIKALPTSIKRLYLDQNQLGDQLQKTLFDSLSALHTNVKFLSLRNNDLGMKSYTDLRNFFFSMPKSVSSVDISGNNFNLEPLEILALMPPHITKVYLDGKSLNCDKLRAKQLQNQLQTFLEEGHPSDSYYHAFKLAVEIDDLMLNKLVRILEKQNTSPSLLLCGLLVDGKIETTAEEQPNEAAWEKRTQDAISFYTKAVKLSTHKAARDYAEFLLWDIKTIDNRPSVKYRMSFFDSKPPVSYIRSYDQFSQRTELLNVILYNDNRFFSQDPTYRALCTVSRRSLFEIGTGFRAQSAESRQMNLLV